MFTTIPHKGRFQQLSTMEHTSFFHRVSKETFLRYVRGDAIMMNMVFPLAPAAMWH